MEFLVQLQNAVGRKPKNDTLRNFVNTLIDKRFQIAGHKISQFEDTRYMVLREFVKNHVPNDPEIKVLVIKSIDEAFTWCKSIINKCQFKQTVQDLPTLSV